jgi:hypothetical protein
MEEQFEMMVKSDFDDFIHLVSMKEFDTTRFVEVLDRLYNSLGFLLQEVKR